jgi:hypothetical protein
MTLKHLRSSAANKRPQASGMAEGQLAINTASGSPGLFFKDSASNLVKVGPVHVGSGAPNASPASGGTSGNSLGEQWLDTSGGTYVFKIWDGSAWRSEAGEFVNTTGDTMTGALGIITGSASTPGLFFSGDANSGLYSPGADQVAISTNGTGRLFVDASGNVGVENSSPTNYTAVGSNNLVVGTNSGNNGITVVGGSTGFSSLAFADSAGTGGAGDYAGLIQYGHTADSMNFFTGALERMRLDSSGRLGVGTSAPGTALHIVASTTGNPLLRLTDNSGVGGGSRGSSLDLQGISNDTGTVATTFARIYGLKTNSTQGNTQGFFRVDTDNGSGLQTALIIDSSQRVGVGDTAPSVRFSVLNGTDNSDVAVFSGGDRTRGLKITTGAAGGNNDALVQLNAQNSAGQFAVLVNGSEAFRVDNSKRLLVGASTSVSTGNGYTPGLQVAAQNGSISASSYRSDEYGGIIALQKSKSATVGTQTVVSNNDQLGLLSFEGSDGTNFEVAAQIQAYVDGTPGANDMPGRLVFATTADGAASPTERMRLDSSGRLGLGSSSPQTLFELAGNGTAIVRATNSNPGMSDDTLIGGYEFYKTDASGNGAGVVGAVRMRSGDSVGASAYMTLSTSASSGGNDIERVRITSGGLVGIGTTAASERLSVNDSANNAAISVRTGGAAFNAVVKFNADDTNYAGIGLENTALVMRCSNSSTPTERARIDSSGRLLVGTSSSRNVGSSGATLLQLESTSYRFLSTVQNSNDAFGSQLYLGKSRGTAVGSSTAVQSGDEIGYLGFAAADGTDVESVCAAISAVIDGTPGSNDVPGRLVFSTTADGASSPTERMRISANGTVLVNKTVSTLNTPGVYLDCVNVSASHFTQSNSPSVAFNRITNDGSIVELCQDGTVEGTISVSGTTVSYNGAHLSRWSQLFGGAERTEIPRGTVLSNIDEMCAWGEEENEQLNRMKVSDVEGDHNVSGVFQAWDDDDDTYTDDFYCAMTGDFIIRIAEGVTVQRGDLLMSAGDGTAKPQDDDIIRSKTIAKVTSTHITCTYEDGSYCVPCVLMAC